MFKKLQGLPLPYRQSPQVIPFSMTLASYHIAQNEDFWNSDTIDVVEALESERFTFRILADRTFEFDENDLYIVKSGAKLFTIQGEYDGLYLIDMDHHTEKAFGYDSRKHQFFYVKMHMSPADTRIVVHDRSYYLSKFMV